MNGSHPDRELAVVVHGGAGRYKRDLADLKLPAVRLAVDEAWRMLCAGAPGEEAVAAALRVLEGSQYFNAGFGGYPNVHGIVLLDVGLMRGTREFVSLVNVRRVKYPSAVALDMLRQHKALMTIWTHELMSALDAAPDETKERYGLVAKHEDMVAPYVKELLRQKEALEVEAADPEAEVHGTVGCVVRDARGQVHAGTSTGGVSLKFNGRVGDTPIVGSGVFADNEIGALSTTGHGESILFSMLSGFIVAEMRRQLKIDPEIFARSPGRLKEILDAEFSEMTRKARGRGAAIIVVPAAGDPQYAFNADAVAIGMRTGFPGAISRETVFAEWKSGERAEL